MALFCSLFVRLKNKISYPVREKKCYYDVHAENQYLKIKIPKTTIPKHKADPPKKNIIIIKSKVLPLSCLLLTANRNIMTPMNCIKTPKKAKIKIIIISLKFY